MPRLDKENLDLEAQANPHRQGKCSSRSASNLASTRKMKVPQHKPSRLDKENSGLAAPTISPRQGKFGYRKAGHVAGAKENENFIGHRGSFGLVRQVVSPRQGKFGSRKASHIASTYKIEVSQGKPCRLDK
jgi:hypothetical protein